jgi:chemotaxis protein methyltransferase CheR
LSLPVSPAMPEDVYLLLNELITQRFGIEVPEHRKEILETRLRPRVETLRLPSFWDYYLHVRGDKNGERQRLAELVTNNETFFFREIRQLECFLHEAAPALQPPGGGPLRVLCAGCSSGEEPYSLGILSRGMARACGAAALAIDAFDIDAHRIEAAARAEYGRNALRQLSPEQLARYFTPCGAERWSLRAGWRTNVRFSWGNLVELETFRGNPGGLLYDAVFCRNVLIYFSPAALHRAVRHFAEVLRPGGLLFLGAAESIIGLSDRFETVRLSGAMAYRRVSD